MCSPFLVAEPPSRSTKGEDTVDALAPLGSSIVEWGGVDAEMHVLCDTLGPNEKGIRPEMAYTLSFILLATADPSGTLLGLEEEAEDDDEKEAVAFSWLWEK